MNPCTVCGRNGQMRKVLRANQRVRVCLECLRKERWEAGRYV